MEMEIKNHTQEWIKTMGELLKEIKINNRADALLAPIGKKIETMSADDYRRVMAQLKREKLI